MRYDDYDYDYHNLADNSDELDDYYYDDNADEPWMDTEENEIIDSESWENYYHNIADEIVDD